MQVCVVCLISRASHSSVMSQGNDKNYGFNVVNVNSTELVVFEAAIDLMSYVDIFARTMNQISWHLGCLQMPRLRLFFGNTRRLLPSGSALMGMQPGRKAAAELMEKVLWSWAMR